MTLDDDADTGAAFGAWGVELRHLSATVRPGDDFFTYVDEGWIRATRIPEGQWDYGQFSALGERTDRRVRALMDAAAASSPPPGDPRRPVRELYASYRDTERIDRLGLAPVEPDLRAIRTIRTPADVARFMARPGSGSLVSIHVFPDAGNTRRWLIHVGQGNLTEPILGLPRREFYERQDGDFPGHRAAYVDYAARLLARAGFDRTEQRAADLLALETALVSHQWNLEQLRDRKANYHLLTRPALDRYAPGFPWAAFLAARHVGPVREVVLGTDTAVRAQARIFARTPVDVWRSYLAFHWLQNHIDLLPTPFRAAHFDFYEKRLGGAKRLMEREQRAVGFVSARLAPVVGQLYVERHFPAESRRSAIELFGYLRRAFAERLQQADWMDEQTRREALAKLASVAIKVGHPKAWRDYAPVRLDRQDLMGNVRRLRQADWEVERAQLEPRNRTESWYQSPQSVDASFSVLLNAVEIPAAILQPPFFDPHADPAVNFGAIGAIIGHELGHAFDDQGALYDGSGRLRNWWSDDSRKAFLARTKALESQYSAFTPISGLHLNGARTQGENIADLTGVSLAHRAYRLYLADHPAAQGKRLDGFTDDQRFFLSWAQAWSYSAPESAIRYIIENGYHSPAQYRVNGVMRNVDAWYEAFQVGPDAKLYLPPDQRVRLW